MPRPQLFPDEKTVTFSVRMPESLKITLQQRAKKNRRSLNQEIVWMLEEALQHLAVETRAEDQA